MPISDRASKTIKIPVTVKSGKIVYLHDGKRIALKDGLRGELLVTRADLLDGVLAERLTRSYPVTIAKAERECLIGVRPKAMADFRAGDLMAWRTDMFEECVQPDGVYLAPAVLTSDLVLEWRGSKTATLRGGSCRLSILDRDAVSLNQAYTFASEAYEPHRKSHTGSVFQNVWLRTDEDGKFRLLDKYREAEEAIYVESVLKRTRTNRIDESRIVQTALSI
jgi:hypothetical protein